MSDFVAFKEGEQYMITSGDGLPATVYFFLSTVPVYSMSPNNTLSGAGLTEATGTGYLRKSQNAPTPSGDTTTFASITWSTGANTDWSNNVHSLVAATTNDNTGHALCAWSVVPSIDAPFGLTVTPSGSGGTFTAGTKYWQVTAVNAYGETTGGQEVSTYVGASGSAALSWNAVTGAVSYNVYRSTTGGGETASNTKVNAAPIMTASYTDTGGATVTGSIPTTNTTCGPINFSQANLAESFLPSFTLTSVAPPVVYVGTGGGGGPTPPPPPGGPSAYDNLVQQLQPVLYVTDSTADKGSGTHNIQNINGAQPIIIMPNNDVAWQFNGSTQFLNVGDPANGDLSIPATGYLTIECWFNLLTYTNQPDAFTDSGSEIYTHILGKDNWTNNPATSSGLSSEYDLRYYNSNSPTWTPTNGVGNGAGALCYYAFNQGGSTGSGHDDRSAQGNGPVGVNNPKLANTWYHAVGLYTNRASTVNNVSYPIGYVQLYLNGHSVNSFDGGPIIDTFSSESFHAPIIPTHTLADLQIGAQGAVTPGGQGEVRPLYFAGAVGKIAIYNTLLAPAVIQNHYTTMLAGQGGGGPARPVVTSISPTSGTLGTDVTVTGTNLTGATAVNFGGVAAQSFGTPTATSIPGIVAPAGTAGSTVDVLVTTQGGTSAIVAGDQFTYNTPPVGGGQTAYDTAVLTDSPVLYLDGASATSNQWGARSYSIANHGVTTVAGPGAMGNALSFNGTSNYLNIADPSDGSLSIIWNDINRPQFTYEFWMQLGALNQPTPTPGIPGPGGAGPPWGGVNMISKELDARPVWDPEIPSTDGNEWQFRYFNQNTTDPGNSAENVCGYVHNTVGGTGTGWDDHINTKTTTDWYYYCVVCDMRDASALYGANWAHGWVAMFGATYSAGSGTVSILSQHAPMYVTFGSFPTPPFWVLPQHTTTPLTIGTSGFASNGHFQGSDSGFAPGFYDGKIAKFAVYNQALTLSAMQRHFAAMHP